ncbi:MAG: dTDP-4-dehydrorhamnose reductase [Candidatus Fimivivens sp.]|nr:dTDP-4-dehydrorhamnose reductase [Candidatus Fimivivens sp.]
MRIIVTGVTGQLGYDVAKQLKARNIDCISASRHDFDITDLESTYSFVKEYKPAALIHCAAYTAVDNAEGDAALCMDVNCKGTLNIALACKMYGCKMLYISTDYVFSGEKEEPYKVCDVPDPINVYGKSKLCGEKFVADTLERFFIVRTSWVFGVNGNNFVKKIISIAQNSNNINVVSDQEGSPTYTADLAKLICDMVVTEKYGIYHVTNEGFCTWADFAEEIIRQCGLNTQVNRVFSDFYKAKAMRPKNSKLDKCKLTESGFERLPLWKDALSRFLLEIKN